MINKFAGIKYYTPNPKKTKKNLDLRYEENSKITAYCAIGFVLTLTLSILKNLLF